MIIVAISQMEPFFTNTTFFIYFSCSIVRINVLYIKTGSPVFNYVIIYVIYIKFKLLFISYKNIGIIIFNNKIWALSVR